MSIQEIKLNGGEPISKSTRPLSSSFDMNEFMKAKGEEIVDKAPQVLAPGNDTSDLDKEEQKAGYVKKTEDTQEDSKLSSDKSYEQEFKGAKPAVDEPLAKKFGADDEEEVPNKESEEVKGEAGEEEEELKPLVDKRKEVVETEEEEEESSSVETVKTTAKILPGVDLEAFGDDYKKAEPFLKNMSKEARQFFSARIKEQKTALAEVKKSGPVNGQLPPAYYEHPDAYVLAPEYQQSVASLQNLTNELTHWQKQYAAVKAGKDWINKEADANGNIVDVKVPAAENAEDEAKYELYLAGQIQKGNQYVGHHQSVIQNLRQGFKTIVQQKLGVLKNIEDTLFPDFKDEKALANNKHYNLMHKTLSSKGMTAVPPSIFNKLYAHSMQREEYIAELEAKLEAKKVATERRIKLGPSSGDLDGDGGTSKKARAASSDSFDMAEFEAVKNGSR
jgi:hypothetical protein